MVDDSDCSEDYDQDRFFEGNNPENLYQALAQANYHMMLNQPLSKREERLENHSNKLIKQMNRDQQESLLRDQ